MTKRLLIIALLTGAAMPLHAAEPEPNTIVIVASASVETTPDVATLAVTIRGAGKTSDDATASLVAKQKAIVDGIHALDARASVNTSSVSVGEVRAGNCGNGGDSDVDDTAAALDAAADMLSGAKPDTGPCRVVGHNATIEASITLSSVKDAGTAVGLAGRLGAQSARVENFSLRNQGDAQRRAIVAAIANAREQAGAIATASGARLGAILSVTNAGDGDRLDVSAGVMSITALSANSVRPIVVDITPTPVETRSRLVVTFAITR